MSPQAQSDDEVFLSRAIEVAIRIGLLVALAAWCFDILRPFVLPIAWAIIIAVAVYPAYVRLAAMLGGRARLASAVVAIGGLALLLIPAAMLGGTLVEGTQALTRFVSSESFQIPLPPDAVKDWPVIGEPIYEQWANASSNVGGILETLRPQLLSFGRRLLATAAGVGLALIQSILALAIAAVLLAHASSGDRAARSISRRLASHRGEELTALATATVRSVAQGVLGVAVIQSFLAGVGFLAIGVPGAGLWTLVGLLLAVIQIGLLPVTLPILIWVWANTDSVPATVFTIWILFVSIIDNFLKPLLLGRGMRVPTAVIFLGSIGGFLWAGIIGLFVGAVVLVLGFTLFRAWLGEMVQEDAEAAGAEASAS